MSARVAKVTGAILLPEAYDRLRPRPSLAFSSPRELERLERRLFDAETGRYAEAAAAAASGRLVIADTGFLGPLTYTAALVRLGLAPPQLLPALCRRAERRLARGRWGSADLTIYLETSADERRGRVARDPGGHPRSLAQRHEAAGRVERRLYARVLAPRIGDRLVRIRATDDPATVAKRVARAVRERPRGRSSPRLARALVRALALSAPAAAAVEKR